MGRTTTASPGPGYNRLLSEPPHIQPWDWPKATFHNHHSSINPFGPPFNIVPGCLSHSLSVAASMAIRPSLATVIFVLGVLYRHPALFTSISPQGQECGGLVRTLGPQTQCDPADTVTTAASTIAPAIAPTDIPAAFAAADSSFSCSSFSNSSSTTASAVF